MGQRTCAMKSSIEIAREIRNAISNGVTEKYTAAQIDEVRRPLVDDLVELRCGRKGELDLPEWAKEVIDAALAQCKETLFFMETVTTSEQTRQETGKLHGASVEHIKRMIDHAKEKEDYSPAPDEL